jgi:NAD(P)H dehydrogenase (quinone)
MKVLIVHAHPEPRSFNAAMTHRAKEVLGAHGHPVVVSDLYAMHWNPVSGRHNFSTVADPDYFKQQAEETHASEHDGFADDIEAELEKLEWCDALILQFPLWWFGLPGILKGWVDRVFVMGRVYGGGRWYDRGAFAGRRAMLALTTGGPPGLYAEDGLNGAIDDILFPIQHGVLFFTGFAVLPPFIAWAPVRADEAGRARYLREYGERVLEIPSLDPIPFEGLDAFDPRTFRRRRPDRV